MLKKVPKHLPAPKHWDIIYHKPKKDAHLPPSPFKHMIHHKDLPECPVMMSTNLIGFLHAAHTHNVRNCRSTTLPLCSVVVMCPNIIGHNLSLPPAPLKLYFWQWWPWPSMLLVVSISASSCLNWVFHLKAGLFSTRCDNQSAINMINAWASSEHYCHIDIKHLAIQD